MSQETRQMANRQTVSDLLGRAAVLVDTANELANAPSAGGRRLPPAVRRKTKRAVTVLESLARDVAAIPVTRNERIMMRRRKQEAKA